ncbi:M4 family metallopeptidase [Nocardioides albus]|uniref:Neutral metalloproteinase n=1 Tax=Nocardioides albus TaxID=1841 RepID=A0A7W5A244_9ACTN|nr:M4 family metallopeptidase [Nocardioides albus]MBB3087959.1 Zn-dependent metalloprotease [Nocardioides albus]GGU21591.1 peptidase [Nocardioides albus]
MRRFVRTAGVTTAAAVAGTAFIASFGSPAGATPAGSASAITPTSITQTGLAAQKVIDDESIADEAVSALTSKPTTWKVGPGQELEPVVTLKDADGATHVRMNRTYEGLDVVGGDLVAHQSRSGEVTSVSQGLTEVLDLSVKPTVTGAAATKAALTLDAVTRTITGLKTDKKHAPRLVVDAVEGSPTLAWRVTTTGKHADGTPSRLATYVDAATGKVLRRVEGIHTIEGEGNTLYSGTVPLQVKQNGSTYELRDETRGGTYTTDMKNAEDSLLCQLLGFGCSAGTVVTSPTTTFGNGSNADRATAAADAQYGTNVTWDYFQNVHARDGIFGDGSGSFNRVHYGKNYVNAFWDGEKMTYGDGDGVGYGPLVSLDVAGHEMTHGVTENTSGLEYAGESGGLNESTSDIFGTAVEFYADNAEDQGDYLIGESFILDGGDPLRRMDNPSSDGKSVNCWSSSTGDLDVHYSSGVGNHFFYLLAEGSGSKTFGGVAHSSTTCDGSTIAGIGRDKAEQIWFRANSTYFTSTTDYAGARAATVRAASDLYGASSAEVAAVEAAWTAVSVG